MKDKNDVLDFILDKLTLVGFGNYLLGIKDVKTSQALAMIEVSEIGQQIILTLPSGFYKRAPEQQVNILLHELIHGRISLQNQRIEQYTESIKESEEEKCVNDITMLAQRWD